MEDKEEKENQEAKGLKIAEAESRGEDLTVAMLSVPFFVDRIGFYLGDQCVQLSCLSIHISFHTQPSNCCAWPM